MHGEPPPIYHGGAPDDGSTLEPRMRAFRTSMVGRILIQKERGLEEVARRHAVRGTLAHSESRAAYGSKTLVFDFWRRPPARSLLQVQLR
jgi:hypothetical protein